MSRICFIPVKCGASGIPCEDTMQILAPPPPPTSPPPPPPPSAGNFTWRHLVTLRFTDCRGGLKASLMIPRDPQPQGPGQHLEEHRLPFKSRSRCCTCMCFCQRVLPLPLPRLPRTPPADHPPLFSLVKEPKGNHISRWVYLLSSSCATLITAPRKDQSSLN